MPWVGPYSAFYSALEVSALVVDLLYTTRGSKRLYMLYRDGPKYCCDKDTIVR